MPDLLSETDRFGRNAKDYAAISTRFTKEFREFAVERARELLDHQLLQGDIKSYRDSRAVVNNVVEAMVVQCVSEGYMVPSPTAVISDEGATKAYEEWLEAAEKKYAPYATGAAVVDDAQPMLPLGGYA